MDNTQKFLVGIGVVIVIGLGLVTGLSYQANQMFRQTALALDQTSQKLDASSQSLGAVMQGLSQDSSKNANVNLNTLIAGEDLTNNVLKTEQRATYAHFHSSTAIKSGAGRIYGLTCGIASSTASTHTGTPSIKLWDNTDSAATDATALTGTTTVSASTTVYDFGSAVNFNTGLYITTGGGVDCTAFYN